MCLREVSVIMFILCVSSNYLPGRMIIKTMMLTRGVEFQNIAIKCAMHGCILLFYFLTQVS